LDDSIEPEVMIGVSSKIIRKKASKRSLKQTALKRITQRQEPTPTPTLLETIEKIANINEENKERQHREKMAPRIYGDGQCFRCGTCHL
jgi:hypothetical protein